MESTIIKKRKLCTDSLSEVCSSLDKVCEHRESEGVAIQYFEPGASTKLITYIELYDAWVEISGILRDARASRYVGIAADTPEYCLPALMLGTVSSGRAFVCLPPCASAIESITNKLKIRHIFTHDDTLETRTVREFVAHGLKMFLRGTKELALDSEESHRCDEPDGEFAYATTTSGTTGEPKIVRVTHASIVANILDLKKILDVSARDVVAQMTPLTFDPSMIEIFLPLSCEATVLVASTDLKNDPYELLKTLTKSGVSVLQSTPSLLLQRWSCEQLKRSLLSEETTLRILLLGGENFPNESVLSRIRSPNNRTRIFDIYGITEVSCWASIREIRKDNFPPCVGRTLSETILEVRDEQGKKVKEGQGTLYIGSNSRICVIDDEDIGLLARPVFRDTGDIVVIDKDGRINLKGRRGRRIKRYGAKVYLTDLENHVQQLPFVENCYALFTESNQSLDLYFTLFDKLASESEKSNYEDDVSSHAKKLSDVHRPDKIAALNQFELTSNGKICKKFLKQVSRRFLQASNNGRSNAVKTFESIWRSLVSFEEDSGFLDSGGSSVIALRITNQLEEKSGHKLPKLMSYLLRNENLNVCREYIRREVLNYEEGKKSTVESPDRFDKKIIEEPSQFVEKSTKRSEASKKMFPWQKCRGRSDFPVLAESERKTAWNKRTKIHPAYHYDLGKCVDASPTIFSYLGGKNYVTVGSHAGVICTAELTKENSPEQWEVSLPNRIEASILVLDDFRGVVGSYDSFVYCVHLKTGEQFWKFATGDVVKCTAVLCSRKETVFFGSYDRRMYCISLEDGSQVWSVKAGNGGICATPCVSDKLNCVIFACLDGTCVSLAQNSGQINWLHRMDYPVFSGPTILETGFAVLCDVSGNLHCVSTATGQTTWSVKIDGNIFSHPCTNVEADHRSILFASENRNIYRMDCSSEGTKLTLGYERNVGAPVASTPFSDGRIIVVARNDGNLIILDSINAEILYNFKLGGDVFSSPVIHEDFIVVGCRDNRLYVLSRCDEDCCPEK